MEGLLKLEEKMSRVERGLDRDTKELKSKLNGLDKGGDVGIFYLLKVNKNLIS
jgi:hypothetical protein